MERAYKLIKDSGIVCFILPHKFLISGFGSGIRNYFLETKAVNTLIHFGSEKVFKDASTYTCIITLTNNNHHINYKQISPNKLFDVFNFEQIDYTNLSNSEWNLHSKYASNIFKKIKEATIVLSKDIFINISRGVVTGADDIFILEGYYKNDSFFGFSKELNSEVEIEKELVKPILMGNSLSRYSKINNDVYLIYPHKFDKKTIPLEESELKLNYPKTYSYLLNFKDLLTNKKIKYKTNVNFWYSLHNSRELNLFESKKIITPYLTNKGEMCIDNETIFFTNDKCSIIKINPNISISYEYCIGILNSNLLWYYISNTSSEYSGGYFAYTNTYLEPFPFIIAEDPTIKIVEDLVKDIMELKNSFSQNKESFIDLLKSKFNLSMINSNIDNWYKIEFGEFLKQLEKVRKNEGKNGKEYNKLTLSEEADWMKYFNEQKKNISLIENKISKTDDELDEIVYGLYGLTKDERDVVKGIGK